MKFETDELESDEPETPPVTYSTIESFDIKGPNRDRIDAGLNVNSENNLVEMKFAVLYGDYQVGPDIDGYVQERIQSWNTSTGTWSQPGWGDDDGVNYYYDGMGNIIDVKWLDTEAPDFQNAANGTTIWHIRQQNRMVINDCTGMEVIHHFALRQFAFKKVNNSTYKIVEEPLENP